MLPTHICVTRPQWVNISLVWYNITLQVIHFLNYLGFYTFSIFIFCLNNRCYMIPFVNIWFYFSLTFWLCFTVVCPRLAASNFTRAWLMHLFFASITFHYFKIILIEELDSNAYVKHPVIDKGNVFDQMLSIIYGLVSHSLHSHNRISSFQSMVNRWLSQPCQFSLSSILLLTNIDAQYWMQDNGTGFWQIKRDV